MEACYICHDFIGQDDPNYDDVYYEYWKDKCNHCRQFVCKKHRIELPDYDDPSICIDCWNKISDEKYKN